MLISRVLSRVSRTDAARAMLFAPQKKLQNPIFVTHFYSLDKSVTSDLSPKQHSIFSLSAFQRFGLSSSASTEPSEKEHGSAVGSNDQEPSNPSGDTNPGEAEVAGEAKESGSSINSQSDNRRRAATKRTAFSDSDSEGDADLSMADMVKLVEEKEELLKAKQEEMEQMKDKFIRNIAEMENVMARTRREAENTKKFAIQNFVKGLLDVADNLGRASTHVKASFAKMDESKDTTGASALLKTLLDGVEMTEKQLGEVFKKFGVEKFDPTNEPFDPNKHNAVFQVPDNTKPPGTVAHVLKAGYTLYDRVIRPAEVGVTQSNDSNAAENNNNTSEKGSDA